MTVPLAQPDSFPLPAGKAEWGNENAVKIPSRAWCHTGKRKPAFQQDLCFNSDNIRYCFTSLIKAQIVLLKRITREGHVKQHQRRWRDQKHGLLLQKPALPDGGPCHGNTPLPDNKQASLDVAEAKALPANVLPASTSWRLTGDNALAQHMVLMSRLTDASV